VVLLVHSNSDTEFINELYKDYTIEKIQANRFINSKSSGRGKISENLIQNLGTKMITTFTRNL